MRCSGSATDGTTSRCAPTGGNLPDRIERVEGDPPEGSDVRGRARGMRRPPSRAGRGARRGRGRGRGCGGGYVRGSPAKAAGKNCSRMGRLRPRGFPRGRQGARQMPSLKGRVAYQRDEDVVGVTFRPGAVRRRAGCVRRWSFARRGEPPARTKSARTRRTTTRRRVTARGCARWWGRVRRVFSRRGRSASRELVHERGRPRAQRDERSTQRARVWRVARW